MDDTAKDVPKGHDEVVRDETKCDEAGCDKCARVSGWVQSVTLEPVVFIHNLCSQVVWVTSQDLMTDKACSVNLGLRAAVCSDLPSYELEQVATQNLVSDILMYRTILETSIKVAWILLLGSWSDLCGRRIPLLICVLGLLGEATIQLLNSLQPTWPVETIMFASLPYSLSGGTHAVLMLCFSFVADISKPRRRTMRMSLLDAAYYLGSPIGTAIVAPLLDAGGYTAAYTVVIALYIVSAIYVAVRLHHFTQQPQQENEARGCGNSCDISQLYNAVQVVVQPRPHRATPHILFLILAMLCDAIPIWGEVNVKYLFVQRALKWDHTQYSHWATFASLLSVCVMVMVVPVASVKAGVGDGWLGVAGGLSRTASSAIYSFVSSPNLTWLLWAGAVVASGKNMAPVAIRSLLSQLAGPQHTGQVFAVMAVAESLVSLAAAPMYNSVYNATVLSHPATYNLLSAGFNFILTLLLLGVTLSMRKVTSAQVSQQTAANSIT